MMLIPQDISSAVFYVLFSPTMRFGYHPWRGKKWVNIRLNLFRILSAIFDIIEYSTRKEVKSGKLS